MDFINTLLIIIGFLSFFLALVVLHQNSKKSITISFSLFIFNAAIWAFAIAFFRIADTFESALFWTRLIYVCGLLAPVSFLYFSSVIVQRKLPSGIVQIFSIVIPFIFVIFLYFSKLWVYQLDFLSVYEKQVTFGPVYLLWVLYVSLFMGLGVFELINGLKKASGIVKIQIKYILLSVLLLIIGSVPFSIILPYLGNYRFMFIGPIFITIMIAITTYAIVRHRLLDIRLVLALLVTDTLMTIVLGAIYAGGLFLVSPFFLHERMSLNDAIISTYFALVIAFSFQPLRALFEKITHKLFYKDHYDLKEILYKLSQEMAVTVSLKEVIAGISRVLTHFMHVSTIDFVLLQKGKLEILGTSPNPRSLVLDEFHSLNIHGNVLVSDELEHGDVKIIMQKHNISVYVPLKTGTITVGCLLFGEKTTGNIYFEQDLKVLEIAGPELSIAIQNAQSFEEIKQFNVRLEEEINKATGDLQKANVKLQELDKMKDEFFSLASHELRTPLTAIRGNSDLIMQYYADKIKDKNFHEMVADIKEASVRLIGIVNDFLNVSRLEQGKIEFKKQNIDLLHLIRDSLKDLESLVDGKQIKLICKVPKEFPLVFADPDRTRQVVYNLVGNAIKFTEKGSVTIIVEKEGDFAKVSVVDTGVGIDKEKQNVLFQKFQQAGNNKLTPLSSQGSGLGLYISKLLVEIMGGKIVLEKSEVEKGSVFCFTLPIAK